MAAREIDGSIKKELLDLADQYDRLAARAELDKARLSLTEQFISPPYFYRWQSILSAGG